MARTFARLLAPLALVAVIVAIYVLVQHTLGGTTTTTTSTAQQHPVSVPTTTTHPRSTPSAPAFYTVRSGDTLSSIALKTGVSLSDLETLNPSVNPNALQTGDRLRLR